MTSALPPGSRLPTVLQTLGWWSRPTGFQERLRARRGSTFSIRLAGQGTFVIISDPDIAREVFVAPPDVLHPGHGARLLEPIVGRTSVILLDEGPHLEQRRLLLPAFHGDRISRLQQLMDELTQRELDRWPMGVPVALHERLQNLALEFILRAVFGLDEGPRLERLRVSLGQILAFGDKPLSLLPPVQRLLNGRGPMRAFNRLRAEVDAELFALMDERRAEDGARDDILAMLLAATHEDGSPMTDDEIRDELLTALVAGHETTASSLAFAFEQLARHPHVQDRLAGVPEDDAYMTATINEVLRRRPVLPNPEPRYVEKPVTIGGRAYAPGVCLVVSAYLIHHDPAIYPSPYAFRPERFLGVKPGTYTFLPFGGGRRRCIGAAFAVLEMRTVLRHAIDRFRIAPAGPDRPARRRLITLTPGDGGRVVLTARRPTATTDDGTPAALVAAG